VRERTPRKVKRTTQTNQRMSAGPRSARRRRTANAVGTRNPFLSRATDTAVTITLDKLEPELVNMLLAYVDKDLLRSKLVDAVREHAVMCAEAVMSEMERRKAEQRR
jgi:hypothetical protein